MSWEGRIEAMKGRIKQARDRAVLLRQAALELRSYLNKLKGLPVRHGGAQYDVGVVFEEGNGKEPVVEVVTCRVGTGVAVGRLCSYRLTWDEGDGVPVVVLSSGGGGDGVPVVAVPGKRLDLLDAVEHAFKIVEEALDPR